MEDELEPNTIKREIVALVMESALYFTVPLQRRLQFIKFFSQPAVLNAIFYPQIQQEPRMNDLTNHEEIWINFS
jgi:hypothetical protein